MPENFSSSHPAADDGRNATAGFPDRDRAEVIPERIRDPEEIGRDIDIGNNTRRRISERRCARIPSRDDVESSGATVLKEPVEGHVIIGQQREIVSGIINHARGRVHDNPIRSHGVQGHVASRQVIDHEIGERAVHVKAIAEGITYDRVQRRGLNRDIGVENNSRGIFVVMTDSGRSGSRNCDRNLRRSSDVNISRPVAGISS